MPVRRDQVNWVPARKEGRSLTIQQTLAKILTITLSGVLAAVLALAAPAPALGQASGTWVTTGSMPGPSLTDYTATLLQNGQVLVAGGFSSSADQVYATAFLYNPSTGAWTETGSMVKAVYKHRATLLASGEVLVTGGVTASGATTTGAELYNPSTGTWSQTVDGMVEGHYGHSAVLLPSGDVVVAGGHCSATYCEDVYGVESAADLYNPSATSFPFTAAASMHYGRSTTQLTLLPNGEALIAAGGPTLDNDGNNEASCSAELFSQGHGWKLTSNLAQCASNATSTFAATLPNGDALIENGNTASEFYDPSTNVWEATSNQPNVSGPLALLATGNVLVAGSALVSGGSNAAVYDSSTNEWTPAASAPLAAPQTLTRLLNGQVLATEGNGAALFTP
jgi:hypothetical protein